MNRVDRFFRDLTEEAIRDGSYRRERELSTAIEEVLAERDPNPKRYVWRASGKAILSPRLKGRRSSQSKW